MKHTANKVVKVAEIANLATGLYLQTTPGGETRYLQARHFDEDGNLDFRIEPEIHLEPKQSRHLLLPGDVLFACKGHHHFAALYQPSMGRAVASSIFLVLRLHSHAQVLPAYLAWYLNHPDTQARLRPHSRMATVSSLTLQDIGQLEVRIPPLAKQSILLQVETLRGKEMALRREIQTLRENLIQNLLLQSFR